MTPGLWRRHVAITARAFGSFAGRHTSALVIGGGVLVLGSAFRFGWQHPSNTSWSIPVFVVVLAVVIVGALLPSNEDTPHEEHRELTWTGGAR